MSEHKVRFDRLEWTTPFEGVRHRIEDVFGRRLRLVEYAGSMPLHWCERGHVGYVLDGRLEIEFEGETVVYEPGDGVCIPDGAEHRHRARVLTDVARVFFVEEA